MSVLLSHYHQGLSYRGDLSDSQTWKIRVPNRINLTSSPVAAENRKVGTAKKYDYGPSSQS